ncbi:hypothetical protein KP509_10G064500 [Ceratopteris richardii]|uniref:Heat shock 70 kDa protein 12A n=1 Tax=Ceratopteris richardii TaxID=49495 RepID=A0A8T2TZQ9_CERRI|nr:hypothetical protein KP509_10G064500 [Ceratopteris richardii]
MSSSCVGEYYSESRAEVVIAVDFGTTFSGFAFAKTSATPLEIFDNCEWPGDASAGAAPYCKNQTSLLYIADPLQPKQFQLKDWGWSAFNAFRKSLSTLEVRKPTSFGPLSSSSPPSILPRLSTDMYDSLNLSEDIAYKAGYFAHKFKLHLAPNDKQASATPLLPGDLSTERMIVDYLRSLTQFIMDELSIAIRKDFSMRDVQWCLTVPAVWDERAKQRMKICAEKAGMVKGVNCPRNSVTSPRALHIILEPEAASAYCQQQVQQNLKLKVGDRLLIADVGGGTIDVVVHEVLELDPSGCASKVKEVVASYGQLGGGTFVDVLFFNLVSEKIACFSEYCRNANPSLAVQLYSWWQGIKADFKGLEYSEEYSLINCGLSEAWKQHDRLRGVVRDDEHYEQLLLTEKDLCSILDPEVDKVLNLIDEQVKNVSILMVVGGFAASPYLRKRVLTRFRDKVDEIIIPTVPGRAVCRGAVELHMKKNYVKSRISKVTYGTDCLRYAKSDDRQDLVLRDDDGRLTCRDVFSVFVRAGEEVEIGSCIEKCFYPSAHYQKAMNIGLYSSPRTHPRYIKESDCKKEGKFKVDMSEGMELDKSRKIKVKMTFGGALVSISAVRCNFGTKEEEHGLAVTFHCSGP